MDLHGCPRCGATAVSWVDALIDRDGVLARRYSGACEQCGEEREFVFELPERPTPPRPGATVTFGAAEDTSLLFDAGEWLEIAEMLALASGLSDVPAAEARESAAIGVACYDEILKFLPDGADEVPAEAFRSAAGQAVRDRSPERFRRADIVARRGELAARY